MKIVQMTLEELEEMTKSVPPSSNVDAMILSGMAGFLVAVVLGFLIYAANHPEKPLSPPGVIPAGAQPPEIPDPIRAK